MYVYCESYVCMCVPFVCMYVQNTAELSLLEFKQQALNENAERLFAMTPLNIPHKSRDWEGLKRYA